MWFRRAEEEAQAVKRKVRRAVEDAGEEARRHAEDTLDTGKKVLSTVTGERANRP
jgi:hypothetical protein